MLAVKTNVYVPLNLHHKDFIFLFGLIQISPPLEQTMTTNSSYLLNDLWVFPSFNGQLAYWIYLKQRYTSFAHERLWV